MPYKISGSLMKPEDMEQCSRRIATEMSHETIH
jgi:hypothetical protein